MKTKCPFLLHKFFCIYDLCGVYKNCIMLIITSPRLLLKQFVCREDGDLLSLHNRGKTVTIKHNNHKISSRYNGLKK